MLLALKNSLENSTSSSLLNTKYGRKRWQIEVKDVMHCITHWRILTHEWYVWKNHACIESVSLWIWSNVPPIDLQNIELRPEKTFKVMFSQSFRLSSFVKQFTIK